MQPGKDNLTKLFNAIKSKGFGIAVPTPFAQMELILKKKGFRKTMKYDSATGEYCELWCD